MHSASLVSDKDVLHAVIIAAFQSSCPQIAVTPKYLVSLQHSMLVVHACQSDLQSTGRCRAMLPTLSQAHWQHIIHAAEQAVAARRADAL